MLISVVILNYNVCHFLHLCLESVRQSLIGLESEIIVVDNNSSDNSVSMVKNYFPEVVLLENKENIGFAKANNQAVSIAKGEYVCILNPDTVVTESTFVNTLQKAQILPNLGVLGVQLIDGKGVFLPESKRNLPTAKVSICKLLGSKFHRFAPYYANHLNANEEGKVSILVGAFMLLKKEIYEKVKGFDERYFMYGEDIDLSYTIKKNGFQNYYYGSEKVIHFKGESTLKDDKYRKHFYGAMRLFYNKYFKSSFVINSIFFTGIKLASILTKKNEGRHTLNFNTAYLLSSSATLAVNISNVTSINTSLTTVNKIYANVNLMPPTLCFFDMTQMSFSQAILLIHSNCNSFIYFRFLLKNNKIALGSDTSNGRGQVISL